MFEVSGELTLLGITKPLTKVLQTGKDRDPWGGTRLGFATSFTIKRSEFGMKKMPAAAGDEVTVAVSVEGVRQK